jgi:hypothetical protein
MQPQSPHAARQHSDTREYQSLRSLTERAVRAAPPPLGLAGCDGGWKEWQRQLPGRAVKRQASDDLGLGSRYGSVRRLSRPRPRALRPFSLLARAISEVPLPDR